MLSAAVRLYERPIILTPDGQIQTVDARDATSAEPIRLGLINNHHYLSICKSAVENETTQECSDDANSKQSSKSESDCSNPDLQQTDKTVHHHTDTNDIGLYIGVARTIADSKRATLIRETWRPPQGYAFPFSLHSKKGKIEKRYMSHSYLDQFKWLEYSNVLQGLLCKYCTLMVDQGGECRQTPLSKLVKTPLKRFAKLLGKDGDLPGHESNNYHREAEAMAAISCVYMTSQTKLL